MKTGDVALVLVVVGLVAAAAFAYSLDLGPAPRQGSSTQTFGGQAVTIQELMAGEYPSAVDKNGTLGTSVTVLALRVLYVNNETDGDWHVGVTDGVVPVFITEITPAYQAVLGRPPVGSVVDESGRAFCDVQHENESWHGDTCWEVHPVTAWRISAGQTGGSSMTPLNNTGLSVGLREHELRPGTDQTISVEVRGFNAQSAPNASVMVSYPPGVSVSLECEIGTGGSCSVTFPVDRLSALGTYAVRVQVGDEVVYTAFLVLSA